MFHETKQILKTFLLLGPCSPENAQTFSRFNFSDNFVQVHSLMHSNVQLMYLLSFFAVSVAFLIT